MCVPTGCGNGHGFRYPGQADSAICDRMAASLTGPSIADILPARALPVGRKRAQRQGTHREKQALFPSDGGRNESKRVRG
jgi:hypothetical protein